LREHAAALLLTGAVLAVLGAGCSRDAEAPAESAPAAAEPSRQAPIVTISRDQAVSPVPPWQAPEVAIDEASLEQRRADAAAALESGELFGEPDDAVPLYLALFRHAPDDAEIARGYRQAVAALIEQGDAALDAIDGTVEDNRDALHRAHEVAAVARVVAAGETPAPAQAGQPTIDETVTAYLGRVDRADAAAAANRRGEQALNAGRIGVGAEEGALDHFHEALRQRPGDERARQGVAAAESALIRRAERAADADDYAAADRWLDRAAQVRPQMDTVEQARERIAGRRAERIGNLRDLGLAALTRDDGLEQAREHLATLLRIAPAGHPAASELRERIELATHYGLFRPGQAFTDALRHGGRGPEMVVIPHGAFRMGAAPDEEGATDVEYPARNIRFDRGLAVSRHEITVREFGNFVQATGYEPRATRRGHSTVYDERSGNLVRRSGVDWRDDYAGRPADPDMPVVHVSAKDAMAYADWLSEQTGREYRLPSEAEFEYALRAGSSSRFPWGDGAPPAGAGNFTGAGDVSPSGRHWRNAFEDYGDGAWGPAPVGSYRPNAFGLHDLAGNVSEWVADCWHDSYRRAPDDAQAWINPGCRTRVVRGGSWASSPTQTRSAWRLGVDADTTNARVGFRVVREI
jgi:formylglycine-generating enzyme required for sulfatase activity